jgi:hypothetical protein
MFAARITLPHFSFSAARNFRNSAGELAKTAMVCLILRFELVGSSYSEGLEFNAQFSGRHLWPERTIELRRAPVHPNPGK